MLRGRSLKECLTLLEHGALELDSDGLASLIRHCGQCRSLEDAARLHRYLVQDRRAEDTFLGNLIVQMLGSCGDVGSAVQAFHSIARHNLFSWNILLSVYARNGHMDEATSVFTEMQQRSSVSWNTLLTGYAQSGKMQDARTVLDKMPAQDLVSWNSLLTAYAQRRDVHSAEELLSSMPQLDLISWNAAIQACLHSGQLQRCKDYFQLMPQTNIVSWNMVLQACIQAGSLDTAKEVYDRVPEPNSVTQNLLIHAYSQAGRLEEAVNLFHAMLEPDAFSLNALITGFCQTGGDLVAAKQLFDSEEAASCLEVVSWNCMLAMYLHCEDLVGGGAMFDRMPCWDLFSWNAMLAALSEDQGRVGEAVDFFFDRMPEHDSVSWNSLLRTCAVLGPEEADPVLHKMAAWDVVSVTTMITANAERGQVEACRSLFEQMPTSERNVVCWNAMLKACSASVSEALSTFHRMPSRGVVSWNTIVQALVDGGRAEDARSAFGRMPAHDPFSATAMLVLEAAQGHLQRCKDAFDAMPVKASVVPWNALVQSFGVNAESHRAAEVFSKMPLHDSLSWNSLVVAFALSGRAVDAIKLVRCMDVEGIRGDGVTMAALLESCCNLGLLAEGRTVHARMAESRMRVSSSMVSSLLGRCGAIVDGDDRWYVNLVKLDGRRRASWNAAITAYAQNGGVDEALALMREMGCEGVHPDAVTFVCVLSACSHGGKLAQGLEQLLAMAIDHGIEPDESHYLCIVDLLGRAGELELAEWFVAAVPFEFQAKDVAWGTLLSACSSHGDGHRGRRVAAELLRFDPSNSQALVFMRNVECSSRAQFENSCFSGSEF